MVPRAVLKTGGINETVAIWSILVVLASASSAFCTTSGVLDHRHPLCVHVGCIPLWGDNGRLLWDPNKQEKKPIVPTAPLSGIRVTSPNLGSNEFWLLPLSCKCLHICPLPKVFRPGYEIPIRSVKLERQCCLKVLRGCLILAFDISDLSSAIF